MTRRNNPLAVLGRTHTVVFVLARWLARHPPPGPFRRNFWRSPIRGPWLTSVLGVVLLVGFTVVFLTGLFSYAAYNPWLGGGFNNDPTPGKGLLGYYLFGWPTRPTWLYWLNQGLHVTLGLALIPVVFGKLWSVLPKLFEWPPVRSPAQAVERVSLLLLVGSTVFELVTGVMNIQYFYAWPFSFYQAHFYGAWVFIAAMVVHVAVRTRRVVTALRGRSLRTELRTGVAATVPEPPDPDHLVSPDPAPPTISRRGALGLVTASSLTLVGLSVGQTLGGATRSTALLSPRGQTVGEGPNAFQVNKTAALAGITPPMTGPGWRLELRGASSTTLSLADLLAMPQHTAELPIACVEGWSTGVQSWSGVRLVDLARSVGADADASDVLVESLQPGGAFGSAVLAANQIRDPLSLLALRVNGADLSLDHGFPARVIVPAAPGVHNTKWVSRMTFSPGRT
ncbi:MAG: molybdopterin-dependent oxidoreductase [Pseudonocardiaceae bacterium]